MSWLRFADFLPLWRWDWYIGMVEVDDDFLLEVEHLWAEVGKAAAEGEMVREEELMYEFVKRVPELLGELRRLTALTECDLCGLPRSQGACSGSCDRDE